MNDWNVIISIYHDGYKRALRPCRDRIALAALSEPAAGLNPYATWRSCFDRDLRDAELAYQAFVRRWPVGLATVKAESPVANAKGSSN